MRERFVVRTQRRLAELMRRDFTGLALVAVTIDGVHFADHVVLAAVGIESNGHKQVLRVAGRSDREYRVLQGAAG